MKQNAVQKNEKMSKMFTLNETAWLSTYAGLEWSG